MAAKIATVLARNVFSLKSAHAICTFFKNRLSLKSTLAICSFFQNGLTLKSALALCTFFWNRLSLKSVLLAIYTFFSNGLSLKSILSFFFNVLSFISKPALATLLAICTSFWNVLLSPFAHFRNIFNWTSANGIGHAIGFADAVIGIFDKRAAEQVSDLSLLERKLRVLRADVQNALSLYEKEGPWGKSGLSGWTDGAFSGIESITVRHKSIIDAIQVNYRLNGTDDIKAQQHGGHGGLEATIKFEKGEYLTQIEGYFGYGGGTRIKSLTFKTNLRDHGPYGSPPKDGSFFRSSGTGMIVGFHGSAGNYLEGLGVYRI